MENKIEELVDVVDRLAHADLDGDGQITVEEILTVFGDRAFGPLFMILALLQLLPTGLIPFVTGMVAVLALLFALQLFFGVKGLWVPKKARGLKMDALKVSNACEKARPYVVRLSKWMKPRASQLTDSLIARKVVALCGVLIAAMIFFLGFIPGAATPPAFALLFLGVGLIVRDGWVVLLSYVLTAGTLLLVYFLAETIIGLF